MQTLRAAGFFLDAGQVAVHKVPAASAMVKSQAASALSAIFKPSGHTCVVRGCCSWQAVRSVFNIAIGADSADLQRTARSALLQMLNTIVKRVTQAAAVSPCLSISI